MPRSSHSPLKSSLRPVFYSLCDRQLLSIVMAHMLEGGRPQMPSLPRRCHLKLLTASSAGGSSFTLHILSRSSTKHSVFSVGQAPFPASYDFLRSLHREGSSGPAL